MTKEENIAHRVAWMTERKKDDWQNRIFDKVRPRLLKMIKKQPVKSELAFYNALDAFYVKIDSRRWGLIGSRWLDEGGKKMHYITRVLSNSQMVETVFSAIRSPNACQMQKELVDIYSSSLDLLAIVPDQDKIPPEDFLALTPDESQWIEWCSSAGDSYQEVQHDDNV